MLKLLGAPAWQADAAEPVPLPTTLPAERQRVCLRLPHELSLLEAACR